jgi:hypothetical protein
LYLPAICSGQALRQGQAEQCWFGEPPVGKREFIRTRQQVDGRKDIPAQAEPIVPGKPGAAGKGKGRRGRVGT